nr:methyltransferase [uncultured Schaedlerella sp.]
MIFQVTGIAVLLVFYGCYFIKMIAQSRKGIKTDQTELVTNGIYWFSRNPAFLGFDLVYIGILLMFFHWILLAASVFAGVMLHLQIVYVEERFLKKVFGEEYLEYQKKVCRYLGRK